MADIIQTMTSQVGNMTWGSLGGVLFIFIIFFILLVIFGGAGLFMWWKSYNLKVTIFQPLGQELITEEEKKAIEEDAAKGITHPKLRKIIFDYMKKRVTHGKYTSIKGTAYFTLFMPLKKIKPVPLQLMYHDGVYLMQLSKDVYIPIPRPNFHIHIGDNMSISVAEQQEWVTWSNMMAERINAKWQNPDAGQKQTFYFVVGILAMVVIGGLILWLIYESAKKGLDVKTFTTNFAEAIKNSPSNLGGILPK